MSKVRRHNLERVLNENAHVDCEQIIAIRVVENAFRLAHESPNISTTLGDVERRYQERYDATPFRLVYERDLARRRKAESTYAAHRQEARDVADLLTEERKWRGGDVEARRDRVATLTAKVAHLRATAAAAKALLENAKIKANASLREYEAAKERAKKVRISDHEEAWLFLLSEHPDWKHSRETWFAAAGFETPGPSQIIRGINHGWEPATGAA